MANAFQTILNHPKEMAAAYEKEFGAPVKLSSGMKNAAEEWLMRFIKNAVISPSTDKIFEGVGDVKQKEAPVGITTFSKLRDVKKGVFEASPIYDMDPVFGVGYPTVLVICDRAPHPNAAKLLVRYMMDEGIAPWNVIGDYPSRSDLEDAHVKKFKVPYYSKAKIWDSDAKHIFDTSYDYMQFVMSIGK
jgi:iron(III) transport system substrate-binding protein